MTLFRGTLFVALPAALTALTKNPLRAALTACGILVGVASVTTVIALGEGADLAVRAQVKVLGENLLTIQPRAVEKKGASVSEGDLTDQDAAAIATEISEAEVTAPVVQRLVRVVSSEKNASTQAIGTTLEYFAARGYELSSGSFWNERAERAGSRLVLLGPTTAADLFGMANPVGEQVRIGRHLFTVIGLLSSKGQTPFGMDQDSVCVMPLPAMRSKVVAGKLGSVDQILVKAATDASADRVVRGIRALLRQRHGIGTDDDDDFSVRDSARIQEAQQGVVDVMRLLLLSLAALSLIIGGVGVMNIMLVGVAERTREIGTRLAVGATAKDILVQFLIEAVILSIIGGLLGALAVFLLLPGLRSYFGWELAVSPQALLAASAVSVLVGVAFGILPARRAARLDPAVALRRE